MDNTSDMVTTDRVAVVVHALDKGERLTTSEIAERLGITYHGARAMLVKISARLPITQDEQRRWYNFVC